MIEATKQGRPRILGDRYPSGQLKPRNKQPDGTPPAKIRRMIDMAAHGAADPLLGTPLGWLRMHGKLTDAQVAGGVAYAKLRGQADRAIGLSRRSTASPSYEAGYGSRGPGATLTSHEKASERWASLRSELRLVIPEGSYRSVTDTIDILDYVCVLGHAPAHWNLKHLHSGLNACAAFFATGYSLPSKRGA